MHVKEENTIVILVSCGYRHPPWDPSLDYAGAGEQCLSQVKDMKKAFIIIIFSYF